LRVVVISEIFAAVDIGHGEGRAVLSASELPSPVS
jgi:hypothetical protein